jgi:hypothetical protein
VRQGALQIKAVFYLSVARLSFAGLTLRQTYIHKNHTIPGLKRPPVRLNLSLKRGDHNV